MRSLLSVLLPLLLLASGCAHHLTGPDNPMPAAQRQSVAAGGALTAAMAATDALPPADDIGEAQEAGPATSPGAVADPLEPFNRLMFNFNDKLYFWFLKPVAQGYKVVVPQVARTGVSNFFYNLAMPVRLVNSLLQGKGNRAGFEFSRFLINTTIGVLGFGNPAGQFAELNPPPEDLGQTLGAWGIGNGFYIVWPVLGFSTLRDSVGLAGDYWLRPVTYVDSLVAELGIKGADMINETSLHIGQYEDFKNNAFEPYTAFRNAYIQHRQAMIGK